LGRQNSIKPSICLGRKSEAIKKGHAENAASKEGTTRNPSGRRGKLCAGGDRVSEPQKRKESTRSKGVKGDSTRCPKKDNQ